MIRTVFGHSKLHPYLVRILNNASSRGITLPSKSYVLILNEVITDFDKNGFWNLLDTFYLFAGGGNTTKEFKSINWINPLENYGEFRGDLTSAFVDNGLDGNIALSGYTANMVYFITNRATTQVGSKFTLNNASVGALIFRQPPGISADVTAYIGITQRAGVSMTPVTGNWQRLNATNTGGNINYLGIGLMILSRISNTQIYGINKTVQTTVNTTSTSISSGVFTALHMGATNTSSIQYNTNGGMTLMFTGQSIPFNIAQSVRATINEKYFRKLGLTEIA